MTDDAAMLDALALQIRTLYYAARQMYELRMTGRVTDTGDKPRLRWDGGFDPEQNKTVRSVWLQIAKFFVANQVQPGVAIKAVFADWRDTRSPLPVALLSARGLQLYAAAKASLHNDLERQLQLQGQTFKMAAGHYRRMFNLTDEAAAQRALHDKTLDLSPLFRCCIAHPTGQQQAVETFMAGAVCQYMFTREAYDAVWGKIIPDAVRQEAKHILG